MVGVSVAYVLQNPVIAPLLSLLLHFVGDVLPHWDFYTHTTKEQKTTGWRPLAVMADFGAGIAVGLTATLYALWVLHNTTLALTVFLSGVMSVLPDVLTGPSIYMKNANTFFKKMHEFQRKLNTSAPIVLGVFTQLVVVGISLVLLVSSLR
ncbi:MAG: hypothetical protein RLY61_341 [Candidatus Parcubacteria bacterium]